MRIQTGSVRGHDNWIVYQKTDRLKVQANIELRVWKWGFRMLSEDCIFAPLPNTQISYQNIQNYVKMIIKMLTINLNLKQSDIQQFSLDSVKNVMFVVCSTTRKRIGIQ
ncbi:Hypothetical_protein [Hexamita inflata]|uniref:Hypothetical_protein n=1 Tax=Hexamita inflata TaxID=28002 RepID=A0AA86PKL5_9EUKA|nr:Hypothetical protein HINF_LOCUS29044 [Hexamita inflata]